MVKVYKSHMLVIPVFTLHLVHIFIFKAYYVFLKSLKTSSVSLNSLLIITLLSSYVSDVCFVKDKVKGTLLAQGTANQCVQTPY